MRISEHLREQLVLLDVNAYDKKSAIAKTVENMASCNVLNDPAKFLDEVMQRENLGSTAIGNGVGLPHARTQNISEIVIAVTRLKSSVPFSPENGELVNLVILIGTPLNAVGEYLKVLARLSKLLRDNAIRNAILTATTPAEIVKIFEDSDN